MKKILALICVATMIIVLVACSDSTETEDENFGTDYDYYRGTDEDENIPLFGSPTFDSIDEFIAFVQSNDSTLSYGNRNENGNDIFTNLLVPQTPLEGFDVVEVMHHDDNSITITYRNKNYVFDDRFCEVENHVRSTATYNISFFDDDWLEARSEWLAETGFIPLNVGGRVIYHFPQYSMNSCSNVLLNHHFDVIEGDRLIHISLPAVDGLTPYDMVSYLEMTDAISVAPPNESRS